jgi:site-specific recombinase XerC
MPAATAALGDLVEDYLASLRAERGLAASTITAYRRDLVRYLTFLGTRSTRPAMPPRPWPGVSPQYGDSIATS